MQISAEVPYLSYSVDPQTPLNLEASLIFYDKMIGQSESVSLPSKRLNSIDDFLLPALEIDPELAHPSSGKAYSYLKSENQPEDQKAEKIAVLSY